MKTFLSIALALAISFTASAATFDRTVHDFGKIKASSGAVSCTFTVTNDADEPLLIQAVISSCGCTGVKWTRTEIPAGGTGTIEATYSNDEGPYPFDKTLTVYTNQTKRPVVLHLRGVATSSSKGGR